MIKANALRCFEHGDIRVLCQDGGFATLFENMSRHKADQGFAIPSLTRSWSSTNSSHFPMGLRIRPDRSQSGNGLLLWERETQSFRDLTEAAHLPSAHDDLARAFGCQCVVLAIDARSTGECWEVLVLGGREPALPDAVAWAREGERLGAGEILLTSWDRDGTRAGHDVELLRAVANVVRVPVIASGGVGTRAHVAAAFAAQRVDTFLGSLTHGLPPIPARRCSKKLLCRGPLQRGARLRPPLWRAPHPLVEGTGSSETPATTGFRRFQDRSGHRHMGESFAYKGAMGQGLDHLLSIRDLDSASRWLDAGATQVVIGTAATPDFCSALPRERVIAALDARCGEVVVDGWRTNTGVTVLERVRELAPLVGGFLFTQVEREGEMGGFDRTAVDAVVRAAAGARVTAAGGITTATEVAELDCLGADAQVGMALYTGRLALGDAIAAPLTKSLPGEVWPTVVCDEAGRTLGLVWSTRESLARAVAERRGIYWSRSRQSIWEKGATSGNTQQLLRVDLDCDRDALRFTVRQAGAGFCHLNRPSCWNSEFDLADLERTLADRMARPVNGSGTSQLLADSALLAAKLREEAEELAQAQSSEDVVRETADVFYMALVALARGGGTLADVRAELARRHRAVNRRPMARKR